MYIHVPASHPVQPLKAGTPAYEAADKAGALYTCGTCGQSWDDSKPTGWTPTPGGRCPFEYFHPQETNGTHYDSRTPGAVIDALERARKTGQRVRLFFGDAETGKAWTEESDVVGTIGRSRGAGPHPMRVPLLMRSSRSQYGGPVLDSSIVAIMTAPGRFAYRHPQFTLGAFEVLPSDLPDYFERVDVDGVIHARFKKPGQAARWVAFMTGKRMAP